MCHALSPAALHACRQIRKVARIAPSGDITAADRALTTHSSEPDSSLVVEGRLGHIYELLELVSELPRSQHLRYIYPEARAAKGAVVAGPAGDTIVREGGDDEPGAVADGRRSAMVVLQGAALQLLPWRGTWPGFKAVALALRPWSEGLSYGSCVSPRQVPALLQLGARHTELVKVRLSLERGS